MDRFEAAQTLASLVAGQGGRAYFVGGCVRDHLRGETSADLDIEVHGLPADRLLPILQTLGHTSAVGASFGIFILPEFDIDVALPRTETRIGGGHRDFSVVPDPTLSLREAARRRDFTVNAMMMDVLSGELIDPFDGRGDLSRGILRHVDDVTFAEDALRVLRGCQFAARFGLRIADETVALCAKMPLGDLSRERVEEELKKALLKAEKPSVFFESLRKMGQLAPWFSEPAQMLGVEQDAIFHPEGDVWTHTMQVLDRAAALRSRACDPYRFMLLALCHDLGKITSSTEKDGRIHAYGHETAGLPLVQSFIGRLTANRETMRYLLNMIPLHMKPNRFVQDGSSLTAYCRMFDAAASPEDLILFAKADSESSDTELLTEKYREFQARMAQPFVTGKDLLAAGVAPGKDMAALLRQAHGLRLAGVDRETALRQIISKKAAH